MEALTRVQRAHTVQGGVVGPRSGQRTLLVDVDLHIREFLFEHANAFLPPLAVLAARDDQHSGVPDTAEVPRQPPSRQLSELPRVVSDEGTADRITGLLEWLQTGEHDR